jgi:signal transduction histidine kinase
MPTPLRILIVEDSAADADLIRHALRRAGFAPDCRRVETEEDYLANLNPPPDLILADYNLPRFDALRALELLRARRLDVPFIIVSGDIGEELALAAMQRGATDYLLKDRLARLGSAVAKATERKRLEEQFRQAQKMEAVGRLAGGVAHDFNNLLTIITGFSEIILSGPRKDDATHRFVQEIRMAAERAAALTRQLLAFSRKQVLAPEVLDLNAVVSNLEKMLRRLIGEDVRLRTSLEPNLYPVKVDLGQIEQVLMNLAVNARDAMPDGGELTIETDNVELDDSYALVRPEVAPGPYARLVLTDTGCGIAPEVRTHLFEPFFTTKEPGKGTGLGLATVYGIVQQSGGFIDVYSAVGQGTTFRIHLPRCEDAGSLPAPAAKPLLSAHGTETILLVEDQDEVRCLAEQALSMNGYAVLGAGSGSVALEIARRHDGPIHLVVTDVVMPYMSGRELTARLADLRPETKVLYISGYTDDAVVRHGILSADANFLQKPFTPQGLARKVREVLDRKAYPGRPKKVAV